MHQSTPTIAQIIKNDQWIAADGTHNGKPLLIRFRSELRKNPDLSQYPNLIKITWNFETNSTGMPDSAASANMEAFEDRLITAVEPSQAAVLTAVITNDGARVWIFYTSNVGQFGHLLTEMPQEPEPYPIFLSTERDPEWSTLYDGILAGTSE